MKCQISGDDFPSAGNLMQVILEKGIKPEEPNKHLKLPISETARQQPTSKTPVSSQGYPSHESTSVNEEQTRNRSYMDSHVAKAVINMGFSYELVKEIIEERLKTMGILDFS